jgi:hypothetical protein
MSSTAISLLELDYLIDNDFDALRIEIVETLSGAAAQNAYEDSTTALRVSHPRRLILDTTYVEKADEAGCAVLHGSRRLKARIVALPASRIFAEPLIDLRLPAARKSALDERGAMHRHPLRKIALKGLSFPISRKWNASCVRHSEPRWEFESEI